MTAYADGTRVGYTMNGIAPENSMPDEISALGAYYATLPISRQDWQIDTAAAEQGQAIVQNGIMAAGVPFCLPATGRTARASARPSRGLRASFPTI